MKFSSLFKLVSFRRLIIRFWTLVTLCALAHTTDAATYYLDNNGTTGGFGTAGGTWAAPTLNLWNLDSTGVATPEASITTTTSDALHFGTATDGLAAGTITLSGTVSANSLTFGSASGAITLGTAGQAITLGGTTPTITQNSAATMIIISPLAGSAGLVKEGSGILNLTAASNFSGGTTVNTGTLGLGVGGGAGTIRGELTINSGATVNMNVVDALGTVSGSQVHTVNISGGTLHATLSGNQGYNTNVNMTGGTLSGVTGSSFHFSNKTITTFASATTSTISLNVAIRDTSPLAIVTADGAAATDLLISGVISGVASNPINKSGAGTLVLSGANSFTGDLVINNGIVATGATNGRRLGSIAATNTGSVIVDGATSQLQINHTNGFGQASNVATNRTLVARNGGSIVSASGVVNRVGNVTLEGGTLTVNNTNTAFGGIYLGTLTGGAQATVSVGGSAASLISGSGLIALDTDTQFDVANVTGNASVDLTVSAGLIRGTSNPNGGTSAGFTKKGTGTMVLTGANTYNGKTTISAGTLQIAKQVSLYNNTPASWTAANIAVANTGTLALNVGGTGEFTTGNVTTILTNLGGANGTSTTGFATGSTIAFDTTNASGGTFTVADTIADSTGAGGGAIGVTKLGTGTLLLSGANTYTGGSTITGGALEVNNTSGSGTGSGTLTVNSTLKGDGSITTAANNFVYINGTFQVGQTGPTLGQDFSLTTSGTGGTVLGISSSLELDLWSTTGADQSGSLAAADMLRLFGDVSIAGTSLLKLGNPNALTFQAGDVFRLFDWTGLGTRTGTFTEDFSAISLAPGTYIDTTNLYSLGTISIMSIPEPSRALLLASGLAGLLLRRRRR